MRAGSGMGTPLVTWVGHARGSAPWQATPGLLAQAPWATLRFRRLQRGVWRASAPGWAAVLLLLRRTGRRAGAGNSAGAKLYAIVPGLASMGLRPQSLAPPPTFRYWVDFQCLSHHGSAALIEEALRALGGQCTGGARKCGNGDVQGKGGIKDYGYMNMGAWDVLWSITAKAMLAAELLRPAQVVNIIPGCLCITRKTSLIRTLRSVYGDEVAATMVPRTFKLPDELDDWAKWTQDNPEQDTGYWMLKNNRQRGTGLKLVATEAAFGACFETTTRPGMEGLTLYRWYLAQQYITNPLLINGRKFGLRLWVFMPGAHPLRVYLHARGLVLFAAAPYVATDVCTAGGQVAPCHVTNYALNADGDVWPLRRLATHLGRARFTPLWAAICAACARVFAASRRRVLEVQAPMHMSTQSQFQLFGVDFLVDEHLHPWLLEVNATPSMLVLHTDRGVQAMIKAQKWPVLRDMFSMLNMGPHRFGRPHRSEDHACARTQALEQVKGELDNRGEFIPLMKLFPTGPLKGELSIPWQQFDGDLNKWLRKSNLDLPCEWGIHTCESC